MTAALIRPDARLSIERALLRAGAALNAAYRQGLDLQKEPVKALYPVYLQWQLTDPKKVTTRQGLKFDGYPSAFAAALGVKVGKLYTWLPASQAWHELGQNPHHLEAYTALHHGTIEDWAVIGEALRQAWTHERIESELVKGGIEGLSAALSGRESGAGQSEKEVARERAARLLPDLPKTAKAQDEANAAALNVMPAAWLEVAYRVSQGDSEARDALSAVQDAARPISKVTWGKQHAECFVCALYPGEGEILDAHHYRVGEREARPNDGKLPRLAFVHRSCHIPTPFNPVVTASSRAFVIGFDAEKLVMADDYQARIDAAYQEFIGATA